MVVVQEVVEYTVDVPLITEEVITIVDVVKTTTNTDSVVLAPVTTVCVVIVVGCV